MTAPYRPDMGPVGKLRRRLAVLSARRPAPRDPPGGGMVSFTFDDAPASSLHAGAPVLEARGVKGSWYISAGLCGVTAHLGRYTTREEVGELAARGHEVACHTFSHGDCARQSPRDFVEDVERNRAVLAAMGCETRTFAYPFGEVTASAKRALGDRFALARAVRAGLVRKGTDLAQAPSVGLQGPDGEAEALRWVARAAAEGAWVILFTHDVQAEPTPWGCTPEALGRVADAAAAAGLEVVTVADGARRMGAST